MSSTRQQILEEVALSQEYGENFISFQEQGKSKKLSDEQLEVLLKDRTRLRDLGVSFSTNLDGDVRLESENTIGAARLGSGRDWVGVQVVPKVGNAAFLKMVEFSSIGFSSGESEIRADMEDAPTTDLVVNYFAKSVRQFLRDHHYRAYEYENSSEQGRIKGRILVEDYVRNSLPKVKPQEVPHRYVNFTADNFENQVVAYAVHLATQLAKGSSSKLSEESLDTLQECRRQLAGVSVQRVTPGELNRVRFTKENEDFEPVFRLCELIIRNSTVTLGRRQRVPFFSFNLDMSSIFERYIATIFRHAFSGNFTWRKSNLTYPVRKHGKSIELDGLYEDEEHSVVVESKYKVVEEEDDEEEVEDEDTPIAILQGSKLKQEDVYQSVAYTGHRDIQADAALLVYPAWEESGEPVNVYDEFDSFGWVEESESGTPIYPVTISLSAEPESVVEGVQSDVSGILKEV